ncbi:hypothetical protein UFOVP111_114 [uncultured Caudovirales phage]|uniref:Uncharacterized protein n=1 Tax=uncultured Caudovirales phage TaxID=2100421 RepID=A0A6J5LAW9_9CAUD|nr:hypothetical protein UFOVP111_114 [uncultured Caudovirales phage]
MYSVRGMTATVKPNMTFGEMSKGKSKGYGAKQVRGAVNRRANEERKAKEFETHKKELKTVRTPGNMAKAPSTEMPRPTLVTKGVQGAQSNPAYQREKDTRRRFNSALRENQFVQPALPGSRTQVNIPLKPVAIPGAPQRLPGYDLPEAPRLPEGAGPRGGVTREQRAQHTRATIQHRRQVQSTIASVHEEANQLYDMRSANQANAVRRENVKRLNPTHSWVSITN